MKNKLIVASLSAFMLLPTLTTFAKEKTVQNTQEVAPYHLQGNTHVKYKFLFDSNFTNALQNNTLTVNGFKLAKSVTEKERKATYKPNYDYSRYNKHISGLSINKDTVAFRTKSKKIYEIIIPVKRHKVTQDEFIKIYGNDPFETYNTTFYKGKNYIFDSYSTKHGHYIALYDKSDRTLVALQIYSKVK
ncbi:immunodominant staphylococcal antigen IsaB family protein [Macrococcus equi]|uniref:immunodominant staphylococcal antigen IsaB family protein n=1 Tax=Macrococcus equi TaxID=3395462 RepID=UPI0039BEBC42